MNSTMKYGILSAVFATMAIAAPAQADEKQGFYGSLNAGAASTDDLNVTYYDAGGTFGGTGAQDTFSGTFDLDTALAVSGSIGYDFGLFRVDAEVSYSRSKISALTINQVNGSAVTLDPSDGAFACSYLTDANCTASGNTLTFDGPKLRQLSALANVWIDIPTGMAIEPYVGGGIGIAGFEIEGEGKDAFAWQLGGGAAYKLNEHVAVTADVRYRESDAGTVAFDAVSGVDVGKIKTWTYGLGLRYTF